MTAVRGVGAGLEYQFEVKAIRDPGLEIGRRALGQDAAVVEDG